MTATTIVLVAVLVAGVVIGVYALAAPRRARVERSARENASLEVTTDWTSGAGDEFNGLSESSRCDLVFAVAALDDERSQQLLEHALNDPAESVALAAAHALVSSGRATVVEAFLAAHPGTRATHLSETLALLD